MFFVFISVGVVLLASRVCSACKWFTSKQHSIPIDVEEDFTAKLEPERMAVKDIASVDNSDAISHDPVYDSDSKCAICWNIQKNKSRPLCGHVFCFKCLVKWSEIKMECPICKMPFDSFKHSIESEDTFKVHTLVQPLSMVYEYTGRLNFLFFEIDLEIYWASEDNFLSYTIDVMY